MCRVAQLLFRKALICLDRSCLDLQKMSPFSNNNNNNSNNSNNNNSSNNISINIKEEEESCKKKVSCLGLSLESLPNHLQFLVLTAALFLFYVVYGYVQEWIFRQEGMKPHGWYLTLVQFLFYTIASRLEMLRRGDTRQIPLQTYSLLALTTLVTMGFSNSSLGYLNYPTQVVFKCCKLVPVMLGGVLIQGKKYGPMDFAAATLMSLGLVYFVLADSKVSPNFNLTGVAMISVALLADAVIGNVQERAMNKNHASNAEVIFFSYSIGFAYLLVPMALTEDLMEGAAYFAKDPYTKYGSALIFSVSGYLGMNIVLSFVRAFGAFATVTVTSLRKALTIALSFILFSKPFTAHYIFAGLLVLLGIYLSHFAKQFRGKDLRKVFKAAIGRKEAAAAAVTAASVV